MISRKAIPEVRQVLAQLFPNVRHGLRTVYNYVTRRPYREPVTFSPTESPNALTEEKIRRWGGPEINVKTVDAPQIRQNLHEKYIDNMFENGPKNRVRDLFSHMLLKGNLGLDEAGAKQAATELTAKEQDMNALHGAFRDDLAPLVVHESKGGYIFRRERTNSAVVIANNMESGNGSAVNLVIAALKRHHGSRLEDVLERARNRPAPEPAQPVQPMPQGPEQPQAFPQQAYPGMPFEHVVELVAAMQHPAPNITVHGSRVVNNNAQNHGSGSILQGDRRNRIIGMLGIPHRQDGYHPGYVAPMVDVRESSGREDAGSQANAGRQRLADAMAKNPLLLPNFYKEQQKTARAQGVLDYMNGSPLVGDYLSGRPRKSNPYVWRQFARFEASNVVPQRLLPAGSNPPFFPLQQKRMLLPEGAAPKELVDKLGNLFVSHNLDRDSAYSYAADVLQAAKASKNLPAFYARFGTILAGAGAKAQNLVYLRRQILGKKGEVSADAYNGFFNAIGEKLPNRRLSRQTNDNGVNAKLKEIVSLYNFKKKV